MLTIRLLGEMALLRSGESLPLPPSRKTRALLGYLIATGRPQRRERLCELLWEVPDDPRGALRWSLSRLRPLVDEPDGGPARLLADRDTVAFAPAGAACDLLALRAIAERPAALAAAPTEALRAVAEGAVGAFLEGLDLPAQPEFQAWCLAEREDARRQHAAVLGALVVRLGPGAPEQALPHARRLMELDAFDTTARAALVGLLALLGRRDEAEQHRDTGLRMAREAGLPPDALAEAERALRAAATAPAVSARSAAVASEVPPSPVPSALEAPTASIGAASDTPRVVVVDDEPELGRMVAEYLAPHGFAVRTATGGRALDALLTEEPADLVVLDVNMPGEDGFAIARRLRAGAGGPRVLFLTAAGDVVDRVAGLELGAVDYLTKPFDLRELRARIRAALRAGAEPPRPQATVGPPGERDRAPSVQAAVTAPAEDGPPSLAVLPFRSLGGGADEELLADGVVEDLITALSHLHGFFVVARNSSFAYKGRAVPARQVGAELGVRYVLDGALRRAADRVRITVQLVEAEGGTPVWADRFDGNAADVFGLQDDVVARVVRALEPTLRRAEVGRLRRRPPTAAPGAYETYLRATARMHPMTLENCDAAIALLDAAIAADPGFGPALAASAWCRMWRVTQQYASDVTPGEEVRMLALADAALAAAPDDPTVLAQVALVFHDRGHRARAATGLAERAVALHPNSALARTVAGWARLYDAEPEAAIAHFVEAMRVDPLDPAAGEPMAGVAFAHLLAGRTEAAVDWGERAVAASPGRMTAHRAFVAALGLAGREEAEPAMVRMLALDPRFTLNAYLRNRRRHAHHPIFAMLIEGLRRAGVPEGSPEGS